MEEKDFYIELGKQVKTLREKHNMNPAQFAKRIGIPRSLLVDFEEGKKRLSAFRLNKILNFFELGSIDGMFKSSKKKTIPFMFDGDELDTLSNGEKRDFLEKVKTFVRLLFSDEIMAEVAKEIQDEYDQSRRDAADQQAHRDACQNGQLNHC